MAVSDFADCCRLSSVISVPDSTSLMKVLPSTSQPQTDVVSQVHRFQEVVGIVRLSVGAAVSCNFM